jgi:endonuclease YncB( thermonuclease family)
MSRIVGRIRAAAALAALLLVAASAAGGPEKADGPGRADAAAAFAAVAPAVRGPAEVSDGDTLRIGAVRVRLFGIDAPESRQPCDSGEKGGWACGAAAADRLRELTAGRAVHCVPRDRDRYGRLVATCSAGGVDLGARLVAEGLARAYTRFGDDYAAVERRAKTEQIGLWRGAAAAPWDWRAEARAGAEQAAPASPDCRIKGNVSTSGARVYHMPGGRFYERTRIDPRRGEAWFCDEEAARGAGFRPSRG